MKNPIGIRDKKESIYKKSLPSPFILLNFYIS